MTTTPRAPQGSRRAAVLDAALALFDERGIGPVSTNHIAQRAGVSPGNLYYWFANKGQIVQALFERWQAESLVGVDAASHDEPAAALRLFASALRDQPAVTRRFALLARELVTLLRADPAILATYRESADRRRGALSDLAGRLVAAGLLTAPTPPRTLADVVEAGWVLSEFAPSYLEALDPGGTPEHHGNRAAALVLTLLDPYLTPAGRQALADDDAAAPGATRPAAPRPPQATPQPAETASAGHAAPSAPTTTEQP